MLDPDPPFRPVRRHDGYLPLEDLGLIGDGTTSALVGLDGRVSWLCLPSFDSKPLFASLLDDAKGGGFTVAPDEVIEARQRYMPDTSVLITELRSPTRLVAVTDALALRPGSDPSDDAPAGRRELIRLAVVLDGSVKLRVEIDPRGGALPHTAADGMYRYLHEESPDGIPGGEGAFVLCSFWLVDNLARQGQLDGAADLYSSLCARASSIGLLPERIDPTSGQFFGNFPQAFSHIGVIASGVTLARTLEQSRGPARP